MRMANADADKCVEKAEKPGHDDEKANEREPLADRAAESIGVGFGLDLCIFPVAEGQADLARAMWSSTFFASTSIGTLPPITTASLNALMS